MSNRSDTFENLGENTDIKISAKQNRTLQVAEE
jgi:hypothetical protein